MNEKHGADIAFIRQLAELLSDSDLSEIEVEREYGEDGQIKVRVARQGFVAHAPAPLVASAPAPVAAPSPPPPEASANPDPAQHPGAVTSPMVGTVSLQAEPGSPAFIKIGDQVVEGQTLLIIEAMKTMNQIPAPAAGTVRRILVDDGSPVEFGAPLVIIE